MKKTHVTRPYKYIHLSVIGCLAFLMVSGALSMQTDPRFHNQALQARLKQAFYTVTYAASNARTVANVINSFPEETRQSVPDVESVPILVFHGIIQKSDGSTINVTERQFRDYIFALKNAGYETISLHELYEFGTRGEKIPPKTIMITFDDGRADSFYNGDPILAAVDYEAVMFPIASYTRGTEPGGYYLSSEELIMMQETGRWEIGSHSNEGHEKYQIDVEGKTGNFYSNHLWIEEDEREETTDEFTERINSDFSSSRSYFEGVLQSPIISFAFPFGDFGQNQKDEREKSETIEAAARANYRILFYQHRPGEYFTQMIPQDEETSLLVRRINMENTWNGTELVSILEKGTQKTLPFSDTFGEDSGWIPVWGEQKIENGNLSLRAQEHQTGASTILDGTQSWKDYMVTIQATSPNKTGFLLWTRFKDDNNNAACNFGPNFVHIEHTVDGVKNVLKGIRPDNVIPEDVFSATATVQGRTMTCSINGVEIVRSEFLDPSLSEGGIGVKIWDEELGKSAIIIEQLFATKINSE